MEDETKQAWALPFTFGGVAAFAQARGSLLTAWQLGVALVAAVIIAAFFELAWVPVLERTIALLPPTGAIQNGELAWPQRAPVRVKGSTFLGIDVDPANSMETGEGADVQVEVRRTELRIRSLFGHVKVPYLSGYRIALNRAELEPWWGAWHPAVLAGIGGTVVVGLLTVWAVLGFLYAWPVRLIAFYANRRLSWSGAWRIGAACLLPGALFLSLAILAYTLHRINLVQLIAATLLHIMIGWVYVLFAPFALPDASVRKTKPQSPNPFGTTRTSDRNPFSEGPPS
ncbi:MAG: hypothetical protein AB9869_22215 [Verrucomicrobiia bacterium]